MHTRRCIELLLIFSSIGCVTFQDSEYRIAQRCRAGIAWWRKSEERCSSNPCSHYSKGWRQGYMDVLMGGDGTCPPVPPYHYWSFKFQTERGEEAIGDWFLGYQHGGASAMASGRSQYHPVPISGGFRQYSSSCLPSDFAPYQLGRSSLGLVNGNHDSEAPSEQDLPGDEPIPASESEAHSSDGGGPPLSTEPSGQTPGTSLPGAPTTEASGVPNAQTTNGLPGSL